MFQRSPRLERRIPKGILHEYDSSVLVTSHAVWIEGMKPTVPLERKVLLHKMEESKHPPELNFFAEARGTRLRERENGGGLKQ
jgi:hypothetical protein